MELLESGLGRPLVLEDQLLGTLTATDSRTLLPALPRTEVDTAAEVTVMTTCPYGGFGGYDGMGRFGDLAWVRATEVPRPMMCSVLEDSSSAT